MTHVEKSVKVGVPHRTAYNQWTQFEEFPKFMAGLEAVRQIDDAHLAWRAKIGGKSVEWTAEITEQVPDRVIAWRSTSGARNAGRVSFDALDSGSCRVNLALDYEPEGFAQSAGDALGAVSRKVEHDLDEFKKFIEKRSVETGAWRGRIHDGLSMPDAGTDIQESAPPLA